MKFIKTVFLAGLAFPIYAGTLFPVGQFAGSSHEDWESFPYYQSSQGGGATPLTTPVTIMSGEASVVSPSSLYIYAPCSDYACVAIWGFGLSGLAKVADGVKGMGTQDQSAPTTIAFDVPIMEFGAYWGASTNGSPATITLRFFDTADTLIGTQSFTYDHEQPGGQLASDGALDWHGFASDTPIGRVDFSSDTFGIGIDGLQANVVPEPSTLVLTGASLLAAIVWQKRKIMRHIR